ncbi:hypothetical protein [Streptomyces sp. HJ7]
MSNDLPEIDPETGRRLCQQCHKRPVPESLGTKPRIYCGRNCRQRAYETRKNAQATDATVAAALAWADERAAKSRDDAGKSRDFPAGVPGGAPGKSRDNVAAPQVRPEVPAPTEPDEHVQEQLPIPAAPKEPGAGERQVPFVAKPRPQPRRAIDAFKGISRGGLG